MEKEKKAYNSWLTLTFWSLLTGYKLGTSISFQLFFSIMNILEKSITKAQANILINLYSTYSYLTGVLMAIFVWMFVACIKLVLENNKIRKKINY